MCGWSLLLEEHVRRREIATYCIPQVLEIWGKYLVSRGWISYVVVVVAGRGLLARVNTDARNTQRNTGPWLIGRCWCSAWHSAC